jgi:hypothetical protein
MSLSALKDLPHLEAVMKEDLRLLKLLDTQREHVSLDIGR